MSILRHAHPRILEGPRILPRRVGAGLAPALAVVLGVPAVSVGADLQVGPPVVSTITIRVRNVFDGSRPRERRFPYTWVNALHRPTAPAVIRRELLARPGQTLQTHALEESERNLRNMEIFREIVVSSSTDGPGRAAVDVSVGDTWSTVIKLDINAGGGRTTGSVALTELNLLGTGKRVLASYGVELDRISRGIGYEDPQLFGSRWQAGVGYRDTSDGLDAGGGIWRPYYTVRDSYSVVTEVRHRTLTGRLFKDGVEFSRHDWRRDRATAAASWRVAGGQDWAFRPGFRYRYEADRFAAAPETRAGLFPADREFHWLLGEVEWVRPRFILDRRLDKMGRMEEIDLGTSLRAAAGPAVAGARAPARTATGLLTLNLSQGAGRRGGPYLFATAEARSRLESGRARQAILEARLAGYDRLTEWQTLVAAATWKSGWNLDRDTQFLLGGESGLRGYPVRRFSGDRSLLAAIEDRVTLADNVLSIFSFGLAVFADTGYAWPEGQAMALADLKSNVGAGLRFAFPRGPYGATLRFDAAYALNAVPGVTDRWFLSIGFGPTF